MRRPVIVDHDGSVDDLLALMLVCRYSDIELRGVVVTPGDCLPEPAAELSGLIMAAARADTPLAISRAEAVNPFPMQWRVDALRALHFPAFAPSRRHDAVPVRPGDGRRHLLQWLESTEEPVTLLVTGPLTNLSWCLRADPSIASRISEVVFMGGALRVRGNVEAPGHDGSAEWNVYWDPISAAHVLHAGIPMTLFPLDVTNDVPVTTEICHDLAAASEPSADLAAMLLALTFGTEETTGDRYCFWDSLTAAYLAQPALVERRQRSVGIVATGASQGRTYLDEGGATVTVAESVDAAGFYKHLLATLAVS